MATKNDPNEDGGRKIKPLDAKVVSALRAYADEFARAASTSGVTSEMIAAPIAREMNKLVVGT
jgi:hypothetical protein